MICADFIAGVSLENGDEKALVLSLNRLINLLSSARRNQLIEHLGLNS